MRILDLLHIIRIKHPAGESQKSGLNVNSEAQTNPAILPVIV
jgi:hypothetical protein